jgi:proline-specific peptidase
MPRQVQRNISKYGNRGDFLNPKYMVALDAYYRKHGCRLRVWAFDNLRTLVPMLEYQSEVTPNPIGDRLKGWDVTSRLPEIQLPTLITAGRYDHAPIPCSRTIQRGIPGSKLVVFPNGSHLPMWENRVEFVELVRDFLDGLGAS